MNINPEEVLRMDTSTLWNTFLILNEESGEAYNKERLLIENGLVLQFPIYYITQDWFKIYPTRKRVKMDGHGKFEISEFMRELEERQKLMRTIILNELETGDISQPRT